MQAPDPIEAIFSRLMPPALSEEGQQGIEDLIDELAGPDSKPAPSPRSRWWIGSGIAAAVALTCGVVAVSHQGNQPVTASAHVTGKANDTLKPPGGELVAAMTLPPAPDEGPVRMLNMAEKTASFSGDEGTATVRRVGDVFKLKIHGPDDALIFEGDLANEADFDKLPTGWARKIKLLSRTLDQAIDSRVMPPIQPASGVASPAAGE